MSKAAKKRPLIEALEPRLLYSADLFGGGHDSPHAGDPLAALLDSAESGAALPRFESANEIAPLELVFIDIRTPDYQTLLDDLTGDADGDRRFEVVLIQADEDGLQRIGDTLAEYRDVDAVHLISHGDAGRLALGDEIIDTNSLRDNAANIAAWRASLDADADILIYGCDLAADADGRAFVDTLAELSGADVAASDDLTGAASRGGDWDLEYHAGAIENGLAISKAAQAHYDATLDITTGLVGRWTFDADASDATTPAYDGALNGNAAIDTATHPVGTGSLALDGADDYVDLTPWRNDIGSLTQGTLSAWVRTSDATNTQAIFTISDETEQNSFSAFGIDQGSLFFDVANDGAIFIQATSSTPVADGNWHHIAITVDSSGNALYLDGIRLTDISYINNNGSASSTEFLSSVTAPTDLQIGAGAYQSSIVWDFAGGLDDARVYDRALSAADIAELANRAPTDLTLAQATAVSIDNPGFEDESIPADGDSVSSANGWSTSGPVGSLNPKVDRYTFEAPEGLNVAYIGANTSGGSLSQKLADTLEAGRSYDLSVMVGDESTAGDSSGWQLRLSADGVLLGAVSNTDFDPTDGNFVRATLHLSADTLAAHSAQYGQNLEIELYNQGDPASVANVHFDDVKLEYTQISIQEDAANGAPVADIASVTDPNNPNDSFSYALADDAGGRFAIDPISGAVTVADTSLLNWATATSHDITVRVTDSAGLAYDETVTIGVSAAPRTLSGTVYEDINGNGDILDDGVGAAGVTLNLYLDDGGRLGRPDTGDSFVASTVSDASGNYSFGGLGMERYWVVADSKTVAPGAAFNAGFAQGDVWAEQTWGGYGSTYFNGVGYQTSLIDSNLRYGGVTENRSDDASGLPSAEHLSYLDLNDGDKSKVDFGFSFNVITDSRDGDDDSSANRTIQGSLRQFIQNSNALSGVQSSVFYLPYDDAGHLYYQDDGVAGQLSAANISVTDKADISITDLDPDFAHSWYRFTPASTLPGIDDSLILDATTQFQFAGAPVVELDGGIASGGVVVNGLSANAGGNQIRGFTINGFSGDGIHLNSGADGNIIQGNHIGTDISGTLAIANAEEGIEVRSNTNLIGGANSGDGNLISGNTAYGISITQTTATDNVVQGNKIGTNLAGDAALPNGNSGIIVLAGASNNLIGGAAAGEGNLLSGNGWGGVEFQDNGTSGNRVLGNRIGADASGRAPLGNGAFGVGFWQGAHDNIIGGAAAGEGNLISANSHSGVYISNVDSAGQATRNNIVQGNKIGTDVDGANPNGDMGNQYNGVEVALGAMNNLIGGALPGQGNLIMNNGTGVAITGGSAGNAILGNRISENSSLGIDLDDDGVTANDSGDGDSGSNALQNMPLLYTATVAGADLRIVGTLNGTANTSYRIEFFRNPASKEDTSGYGEGAVYLGSANVTTDTSGDASLAVNLIGVNALASDRITATATVDLGAGVYGDTSEFAMNIVPTTPGVSVSPAGGLTTTEGGGTASVDFVLDAAPLADVTIALTVSDSAEASLSTNSLTFTTANWNQTQTVTLTGLQDYTNDGDTPYTLITAATSSTDSAYDGLVVADASLTNLAVANSAPRITNLIAQSIDEDAVLTFSSANGNALVVSDSDAGDNPIQISLGANDGILSLSGTTGLTFSGGDGAADASMTFTGKISDINTALEGLRFTPNNNFNGSTRIAIALDDLGNTGSGGALAGSASVAIDITPVNDAPTFTSTAATNATQDTLYSYTIATTDPDGDPLTINATTLPAWLTFTDNGDGTATLSGTPTNADVGSHNVILSVSDGSRSNTQRFSIAVANVNDAPSFTSPAVTGATQDTLYSYTIATTDPDGDPLSISASTLPAWLTFTDNGDGTATLSGTPTNADVGNHNVVLEASDGSLSATQSFTLSVANVNDAPVITSPATAIADENQTHARQIDATDADGDAIAFTITGGADASLFTLSANLFTATGNSGVLDFVAAPDFENPGDANADGVYEVQVSAGDGNGGSVAQLISITVADVNDAPGFTSTAITGATQDTLYSYSISTTDPDGDPLSINATTLPAWLTFTDNGDGTATLSGTPTNAEIGNHNVALEVSDGLLSDTQSFTIAVVNVNDAPTFTSPPTTSAAQDTAYGYTITTADPDGNPLSINATTLPAWLTLTDNGDDTATLSGTPTNAEVGNHHVVLEVSDGSLSDTQSFTIVVANVNDAPTFIGTAVTNATQDTFYSYSISTTDPDGDPLTINATTLPAWLTFVDNGDGTATLSGTPTNADVGGHNVVLAVSDGLLNGTQSFTITVGNSNDAPSITSNGGGATAAIAVAENQAGVTTVSASDADGDTPSFSISGGADAGLFAVDANSGALSFNTARDFESPTDANGDGVYTVEVTAGDGNGGSDTQTISVTVTDVNEAPAFTSTAPTNATRDTLYSYTIATTDPDGDPPTISASTLPAWLTFSDNSDGAATLSGTPGSAEVGNHNVVLTVSDGALSDTQSFTLTVNAGNSPPVFDSIAPTTATADQPYGYAIIGSDPDGDPLTISASGLPAWLGLTDNGDGTATLAGTPTAGDAGASSIVLTLSDGAASDTQSFVLNIAGPNGAPVFNSFAPSVITAGQHYQYHILVTDPEGDALSISAPALPDWLSLSDNGDGAATLAGTPGVNDNGSYPISLLASDGVNSVTQQFTLGVTGINHAPSFVSHPVANATEEQSYRYQVFARDIDGDALRFSGIQLPSWLTLTPSGPDSAILSGAPDDPEVGTHNIVLGVSDGSLGAQQRFQITVENVNDAPVIRSDNSDPGVTEDQHSQNGQLTTTGHLHIRDADPGESFFVGETLNGALGQLRVERDGGWEYTADADQTAIQQLAAGESLAETFQLTTADGSRFGLTLTLRGSEDAPTVGAPIADQTATQNSPFRLNLPADSFSDVDRSDTLRYAASLADGGALPAWLRFDPASRTLSGTPAFADAGQLTIRISADDGQESAAQDFTLSVKALPIPDEPLTASDTWESDNGSHPTTGITADFRPVAGAGASSGRAVDGRVDPIADARADGGRLVLGDATDATSPRAEFIPPRQPGDAANPAFGRTLVDPPPLGPDTLAKLFPEASRETAVPPANPLIEATPPKPLDLGHLDLNPVNMTPIHPPVGPSHTALHNPDFLADLDVLKQDLDKALSDDTGSHSLKAETVIGLTMSLSVGVVSWVTRAGSLMAAFMSIAPLWKQLDPLPVLGSEGGADPKRPPPEDENDDKTSKRVESLFENAEPPPRKD